jgi:hypothetical protein
MRTIGTVTLFYLLLWWTPDWAIASAFLLGIGFAAGFVVARRRGRADIERRLDDARWSGFLRGVDHR